MHTLGPRLQFEVQKIRYALRHNDSWLGLITADDVGTGWGKSSLAQFLANLVDDDWQATRACFTGMAFQRACFEEPEKSFIIWDEVADGGNRRRATSRANVSTMDFFTSWRERHVAAAMCYPHIGRVDTAHLEYCNAWINIDVKRRHAVWRNIKLRTVWVNGLPTKRLTFVSAFGFGFPNMDDSAQWPIYRERKLRWLDRRKTKAAEQDDEHESVVARSATTEDSI